jgi:hypothetical protein
MKIGKNYVVGVMVNGNELFFKNSVMETNEADFTFVTHKAKHFDDKFVADAVATSLEECGYDTFVESVFSIGFEK